MLTLLICLQQLVGDRIFVFIKRAAMSPWTVPQMPMNQKEPQARKNDLFLSLFLPFSLAVLGIPIYIAIILKVIGMMQ